jgi:DNA modification methylase
MARPRNDLNDLTGKEWIKFTRTWFVCDSPRYHQNKPTELHPARFPEEMVADFLRFFTKERQFVLDPFLGSGATLVACSEQGRQGVGIELSPRYAHVAQRRLSQLSLDGLCERVIEGDAMEIAKPGLWAPLRAELASAGLRFKRGLPQFDFAITSPPYWNMLRTSRGGVESKHKLRAKQKLDTHYSDSPADLGNITDYPAFIEAVGAVFDRVHRCLAPGKYLVVVAQNLRAPEGEVKPLAWDLARRISRSRRTDRRFLFQGEKVWCQNTKPLGIWGYPKVFVPNYHHHYCLIFRKAP